MILNETILAKPVVEEVSREKLPEGVLCRLSYPICNIGQRNANNRVYEEAVWDKVEAEKDVKEKIENRALFGHAEHPEQTQSNLEKTSHVIFEMWRADGKEWQRFDVLDTPTGRIVDTLIRAGCQVGVSTRAEGDLEEAEDDQGTYHRVIPESYKYVTTDFTADPSTFGVIPHDIKRNIVSEVKKVLDNKEVNGSEKEFASCLLESMKCEGDDCRGCGCCEALKESRKYIMEGVWALPNTVAKAKKLSKLMEEPLCSAAALHNLHNILGEDELWDKFHYIKDQPAIGDDVRPMVRKRIKQYLKDYAENPKDFKHKLDPEAEKVLKGLVESKTIESLIKDGLIKIDTKLKYDDEDAIVTNIEEGKVSISIPGMDSSGGKDVEIDGAAYITIHLDGSITIQPEVDKSAPEPVPAPDEDEVADELMNDFNDEMDEVTANAVKGIEVGAIVKIEEGDYKDREGKVTKIEEGIISVTLDDGTVVSVEDSNSVTIIPSKAPPEEEVEAMAAAGPLPIEKELPERKVMGPEDVIEVGNVVEIRNLQDTETVVPASKVTEVGTMIGDDGVEFHKVKTEEGGDKWYEAEAYALVKTDEKKLGRRNKRLQITFTTDREKAEVNKLVDQYKALSIIKFDEETIVGGRDDIAMSELEGELEVLATDYPGISINVSESFNQKEIEEGRIPTEGGVSDRLSLGNILRDKEDNFYSVKSFDSVGISLGPFRGGVGAVTHFTWDKARELGLVKVAEANLDETKYAVVVREHDDGWKVYITGAGKSKDRLIRTCEDKEEAEKFGEKFAGEAAIPYKGVVEEFAVDETKDIKAMYRAAGFTPTDGKGEHTVAFHRLAIDVAKGYVDEKGKEEALQIGYATAMKQLGPEKAVKKAHRRSESKVNEAVKVGDAIKFSKFSYPNKAGGTGTADTHPITNLDTHFDGVATGTVVREWEDYETGQVIHAKLDDKTWDLIKDKAKKNIAYVSEFDLVESKVNEQEETLDIDLGPLEKELERRIGVPVKLTLNSKQSRSGKTYWECNSDNMVDHTGIFQVALKSAYISSFSGGDISDKGELWWSIVIYYTTKDGGRNGVDVMNVWYNTNTKDWTFRGVNESIMGESISTTAKEIKNLIVKEASTRAERDKAIEFLEELTDSNQTLQEKTEKTKKEKALETKILLNKMSKILEEKDYELSAFRTKLEEKLKLIADLKNQLNEKNELAAEVEKQLNEVKTNLSNDIKDLKESATTVEDNHQKDLKEMNEKHQDELNETVKSLEEKIEKAKEETKERVKKEVSEEVTHDFVCSYVKLKLSETGLKVDDNSRALLEKCESLEEVDDLLEEIVDSSRRSALHSKSIMDIHIAKHKVADPEVEEARRKVGNCFEGMMS